MNLMQFQFDIIEFARDICPLHDFGSFEIMGQVVDHFVERRAGCRLDPSIGQQKMRDFEADSNNKEACSQSYGIITCTFY